MKRSVSQRVKNSIYWRDSGICQLCKEILRDMRWECDHIQPLCDGGSNDECNLQSLCANCHSEKTALEAIARKKIRLAEKKKREEEEFKLRIETFGNPELEAYRYVPK